MKPRTFSRAHTPAQPALSPLKVRRMLCPHDLVLFMSLCRNSIEPSFVSACAASSPEATATSTRCCCPVEAEAPAVLG